MPDAKRSRVLVIAGSDPGGRAGLLRDVQTLQDHGVEAACAVTAVTAQTDAAVLDVQLVTSLMLRQQVLATMAGGPVQAVKIGMLGSVGNVQVLADLFSIGGWPPVVLDPVLAASSGGSLLEPAARIALLQALLPHLTLLTPNVAEAAWLLDEPPALTQADRVAQARRLQRLGASNVLLKGGHAGGAVARDLLLSANGRASFLDAPRLNASMRGTGCALSSAIAARLAQGLSMDQACLQAKQYVHEQLRAIATPASARR